MTAKKKTTKTKIIKTTKQTTVVAPEPEITPIQDKDVIYSQVYTDGSYFNHTQSGGYGAYLVEEGTVVYGSSQTPETTNNQMELTAVIEGLKSSTAKNVEIVSDSKYVTDAFNKKWLDNWKKNGWKSSSGDVKNKELWEELEEEVNKKDDVKFTWTKAHADDNLNNLCDEVAKIAASKK